MFFSKMLTFIALIALLDCVTCDYNLTVVHITDFHSHWFEFNEFERKCSDEESLAGKCFGGFPRLVSLVKDIRGKEKNVIVLSSGEFFLGRSLNALHGWKVANAILPKLELDAMSLANHDFGSGIYELSAFLYGMKFPILCANMWAKENSFIYSRVNKSAVLDVNGEKIGIVGYLHPETLEKSRKVSTIKFYPEIPAIRKEIKRLESEGIHKIIALGHSEYYTDLEIAKTVKGVDIVIGGNSDVVLEKTNGSAQASTEGNISDNYPRVFHHANVDEMEQSMKNKTLVLHIPPHGKYVGVVKVTFDDDGQIIHESGETVLLDSKIKQDEETLKTLHDTVVSLEEVSEHRRLPHKNEVLAEAKGDFDARRCRVEECSLGNLLTDAMLQIYVDHEHEEVATDVWEKWGPVDAVIFNSGAIRYPLLLGNITIKDLLHSLFAGDLMKRTKVSGKQLKKIWEQSVRKYDPSGISSPGSFLQLSGMRVTYDLNQYPGNRVQKLEVRCRNCNVSYNLVADNKTYIIAMPSFIAEGGDGYPKSEDADPDDFGHMEILLVAEYLRTMGAVSPVLDGRISFVNNSQMPNFRAWDRWDIVDRTSLVKPGSGAFNNHATEFDNEHKKEASENSLFVPLLTRKSWNELMLQESGKVEDSSKVRPASESVSLDPRNVDAAATRSQSSVNSDPTTHLHTEAEEWHNHAHTNGTPDLFAHGNETSSISTSKDAPTETLLFHPEQAITFQLKEHTTYRSVENASGSQASTPTPVSVTKLNSTSISDMMNSTISVLENILIDAMLAENKVFTEKDKKDSLGSSLKSTLKNFFKERTQVTHINLSQVPFGPGAKFGTPGKSFVLDLELESKYNDKNGTNHLMHAKGDGDDDTFHIAKVLQQTFQNLTRENDKNKNDSKGAVDLTNAKSEISAAVPYGESKEAEAVHDLMVNSIVDSVLEKALIKARSISRLKTSNSSSSVNSMAEEKIESEKNTEENKMATSEVSSSQLATKKNSTAPPTALNENEENRTSTESLVHNATVLAEVMSSSESGGNLNKAGVTLKSKVKKSTDSGSRKYINWFPWLL